METSEQIDEKNAPLVKAYQDKIEMLAGLIDTLENTKRDLDTKLASHQANQIDYEKLQTLLFELNKEVDRMQGVKSVTGEEMTKLNAEKFALQQTVESLNNLVQQKNDYISDIESFPPKIKILQEEMEGFQDEHATNKKNAQQELDSIKGDITNLYKQIGSIINT